jgi:hypothetical protein
MRVSYFHLLRGRITREGGKQPRRFEEMIGKTSGMVSFDRSQARVAVQYTASYPSQ